MLAAARTGIAVLALGAMVTPWPLRAADADRAVRLQGSVEPVRSQPVTVPRLTGSGNGNIIIVHLVNPGTRVKRRDLLIEFDRLSTITSSGSVFLALSVSVLIGVVSGVYPAMKASRLDPVRALHGQ